MTTENGDLIQLIPDNDNSNGQHFVHKREALINRRGQLLVQANHEKNCLFGNGDSTVAVSFCTVMSYCILDIKRDPYANVPVQRNRDDRFMAVIKGPLTVELAVFADQEMWKKFKKQYGAEKADKEMENYVLAILNNVQSYMKIRPGRLGINFCNVLLA